MKNRYIVQLSILTIFVLSACTKDYEKINTNPNSQTVGTNEGFLLGVQTQAGQLILDNIGSFNSGMSRWVQYYSKATNYADMVPSNPRGDYNDFWINQGLVISSIPMLDRIIKNTDKVPHPNYRAAALTMKAWIYHNMTNFWGSIPFKDADKGEVAESPEYNRPAFDKQEDIYHGILNTLDEANNTFDLSGSTSVSMNAAADALGGGKILSWKKFANSLRARILVDISGTDPAFAKTELEKIFADPGKYPMLGSNADDFGMTWVKDPGQTYTDPFYQYSINNVNRPAASSGIVNILGKRKDPRMKVYFTPAVGYTNQPTYVGAPPAFDQANPFGFKRITTDSASTVALSFMQPKLRPIITYAELLFIKAEAALKNINVGVTAQQAYTDGIKANMSSLGISPTSPEAVSYLAGPLVVYDPANAMEQIVTQRYIGQFGQSANTFALIRRTGFPEMDYFDIGINKGLGYPVRVKYTTENYDLYNHDNYQAAIAGVNILFQMWGDKLWFAKNAPNVKMTPTIQQGQVTFSY